MKRKFIFYMLALVGAVAAQTFGGTPISVAVFDFTSNAGIALPKDITALVTADLSVDPHLALVERAELSKALGEQAFGLSGDISADAAAKVGKMTGAKVLIAGRVIKTGDHLILIANVVGAETSRLYSTKAEGDANELSALAEALSKSIARTVSEQYSNLVVVVPSHDERIEQILKKIDGKNRPNVMITVIDNLPRGRSSLNPDFGTEMGLLLQKAGFTVVDEKSEVKPDIEISGSVKCDWGSNHGALASCRAVIEVKVQETKTGRILAFDRQENEAVDLGKHSAAKTALLNATDDLAERLVPLLAK